MKHLLTVTIILFALSANAKNFYISNTGNDAASGLSAATAWQSITKLNASWSSIIAGDSILFKKGDVFYGSIVVGKSGTSSSHIVIGAYGTGNKPIITGYTTLLNWISNGNGIYQAAVNAKSKVNLVSVNGIPQAIGRYPNADATNGGYLTYESYSGGSSITDNQLTSATNWTGAEVAIKKEGYILERCLVTNHSGTTITYSPGTTINPRNGGRGTSTPNGSGFGYFFMNDPRTLDQQGEWYFDNSAKALQMYFGTNNPSSYVVKISTVDTLVNIGSKTYINVGNITFEGAGMAALYTQDASDITVQNCDINASGAKGIFFWSSPNILIENCNINYAACGAIDVTGRYVSGLTVRGCNVKNTAINPGMGCFWDQADMNAIYLQYQNNTLCELNRIDTVGYIGIQFWGGNVTIQKNWVNYHTFIVDDGGGIYTFNNKTYTNRIVQDNIVLNGKGSILGNANNPHSEGIYSDGAGSDIIIRRNTCAFNHERGVYLNDPKNISVRDNVLFSNGTTGPAGRGGIGVQKHCSEDIYNFEFKKNIVVAQYAYNGIGVYFSNGLTNTTQPVAATINQALALVGTYDSNTYHIPTGAIPFSVGWFTGCDQTGTLNFDQHWDYTTWRANSVQDAHSTVMRKVGSDSLRLVYNATNATVTTPLDANYVGVDGTAYNGSITLQPFASAVLIRSSNLAAPVVDAGNDVVVSMPVDSTVLSGTVTGSVVSYEWTKVSGPAQYTIVSPTSKITLIDNLTSGIYTFRLKVTNSAGVTATDSVHVTASGILPVTLLTFTGRNTNDKNDLQWNTNTEINSSYYGVERSSNGTDFVSIGRVSSNNSALENRYRFTDNQPLSGKNYYRLIMVDLNGATTYSRTVLLETKGKKSFTVNSMELSANNGTVKMGVESNDKQVLYYTIVDVTGRVLTSKSILLQKGFNQLSDQLPAIRTAIYYIKLFTSADTETRTVLAQQ